MTTAEIQRQYDTIIAPFYDQDPQSVIGRSLARGLGQLEEQQCLKPGLPALHALDVGIGTGLFLKQLRDAAEREVVPYGLDLSQHMIATARTRLPDLTAAVDDASHIGQHFVDNQFDLICTHFVTGFVSLDTLGPQITKRLRPGGYWSFIGGTSRGFPQLQNIASSRLLKLLGYTGFTLSDAVTPRDQNEVQRHLESHGLEITELETFTPQLAFSDFESFMDFAWRGGWLTPFIEQMGLQSTGRLARRLLNSLVFPIRDEHRIVIGLARKPLLATA